MRPRVLTVDHSSEPGGGQLGLLRYARRSSRFDRSFLLLEGGAVSDAISAAGGTVVVSQLGGAALPRLLLRRRTIRRELREQMPDIVVVNSLRAAVAVYLSGYRSAPLVYYARQDLSVAGMGRLTREVAVRAIFPIFSAFLANSDYTAGTIPVSLRAGRRVLTATPLSGADEITRKPDLSWNGDVLKIIWIGRVARWKGLHVLLAAVSCLQEEGLDVRVRVAGDAIHEGADYLKDVRKISARMPRPAEFLGHVADVVPLLHDSHVLVHTSTVAEPFGQVVVQGMAAGLAVVATDAGGPATIIRDGETGVLVEPGGVEALAKVLRSFFDDPDAIERLGRNAVKECARSYGDDQLAQSFEDSIEQCLEG